MNRLLPLLLMLIPSPADLSAQITVPELTPEHELVKATVTGGSEVWHVFTWRDNSFSPVEYIISKNDECVFTGAPGSYLLINSEYYAEAAIGRKLPPDISISVDDIEVTEGNDIVPANFKVGLNKPANEVVTVEYTTEDATASNQDYKSTQGSLTFSPGETEKFINVEILGDTVKEDNETFLLKLLSCSNNALISKSTAVCTIKDDDSGPVPGEKYQIVIFYESSNLDNMPLGQKNIIASLKFRQELEDKGYVVVGMFDKDLRSPNEIPEKYKPWWNAIEGDELPRVVLAPIGGGKVTDYPLPDSIDVFWQFLKSL